jgi:protein-S-isoprenylcysteine O-methyltransferase Ste14
MDKTVPAPSLWTSEPRLRAAALLSFALALGLSLTLPGAFVFEGRLYGLAFAAGLELAVFGLVFLAVALIGLLRARRGGGLALRGAFALCRNPLSAWWILSLLPALALCMNSWLFLAAAVLARLLAEGPRRREEAELGSRFGSAYWRYKAATRAFLPLPYLRPLSLRRWLRAVPRLALLALGALGLFALAAKPAMGGLGATRLEVSAAMPGDEYVLGTAGYTQAIDIQAPASEAWKWLVQVGYRRAGWYNLDEINRLAAKDYFFDPRGSARRILPQFQGLKEGDKIFIVPQLGFVVTALEEERTLLLVGDPGKKGGRDNVAWCYSLVPKGDRACRLVTRFRSSSSGGALLAFANAVVNYVGGATIQQPAMLWGLKRRAERTYRGALL